LVIDASDNFPTRYLINDACVVLKKPFVYGALHGFEGQVSVFNYKNGPTYRCLFPAMPSEKEVPNCNENGVLGVIPGIVGNLQALEAVKIIAEIGEVMSGILLLFNGLNQSYHKVRFSSVPENLTISKLAVSYGHLECHSFSGESLDIEELLKIKAPVQIIDVRNSEEFNAYQIPGTQNIPLDELGNSWNKIDTNRPVYLLCQSGTRSLIAQERLMKEYPNALIYNIKGGINSYLQEQDS
jgi:adenylyltransferase/sulfurtransferase